ncbi:uncharacterized protein FPRO_03824 [Fusarium proliferatum ET1]|uniref:Uncharacterized protein n=1 Tax=Fusarium proliferatum (strain ET1) TaxID=1227346 RepID=A0A1L7V8R7_FUSPR|nr:uncharacterized protein FPRO_03824 [Fusarium proliferatum ET1]CZR35916.1 uncharacterized protein FPRO_03824 [Fusarium proliferatum ET1]
MSIAQPTNYATASNVFSCETESGPSIATLAEGLVMDDVKNLFRDNIEELYDLWVPMAQKSTLPFVMASDDPRIVQELHNLVKEAESTNISNSRVASVQLTRLMNYLESRIKHDRRSRKVVLKRRADSIVTDMFASTLGSSAGGPVVRRRAFWGRRFHKRRAIIAGSVPVLLVTYTDKAERIM